MTKNQKIALGCGGAGCLGLVFLVVIAVGISFYMGYFTTKATNRNSTVDSNFNYNSNSNNDNTNSNSTNSVAANSNRSSSGSLSEDAKHKLFQAASMSGDVELLHKVSVKIGIVNEDDTPTVNNGDFLTEHIPWGAKNYDFIASINTPDKARAYVEAHIDD